MEKKKFKKLSFIGIAIVTVMLMDMVIILASASVGGDSATLDDPTEDGYIQWGDYLDSGFGADKPDEPPTIIRFADGNYINFGLGDGYWYWYWIPGTSFQPGRWEKEWRAHKERGYVEWDISSLAGKTLTANPVFKYEGGYRPGATDEKINPITEGQPSVISDGDLYSYIASGPAYVDPFNVEGSQNEEVDLGASARSDLQAAMDASQSWFAIGFQANEVGNMRAETDIVAEEAIPTPPPTLYVEYISVANTAPTQTGESPTNGSTGISVTPDLYVLCLDDDADNMNATWWSNSSGAWLQFASNWTSFANNTNITQSFTNATVHSTKYWWSLNLTDGIDWINETYSFTTEINNPPNAPTSPECDNQTNPDHVLDHTPYFDWVFSDPDGSDTQESGFHIQVGNDTDWGVIERWDSNQSSNTNSYTTYSGSTLHDGDTYYWRVKTKDNKSVWGSWTSNQNFRMNSLPSIPNLNSPANNSLHLPYTTGSINLSWYTGTDAESDSLNYRWQYAKNSIFTDTPVSGWSGGPIWQKIPKTGELEKETDYYWRVKIWDGLEYSEYSVWRTFTSDDNMAPTQSGTTASGGSNGGSGWTWPPPKKQTTSEDTMEDIEQLYGVTLDDPFYATNTNGDDIVDSFTDPNGVLTNINSVDINGNVSFLLSIDDDTIPEFFWDVDADTATTISYAPGTVTDTYMDLREETVTFITNVDKGDWIYIEAIDQYPPDEFPNYNLIVKTSDNRIISSDMIWRENGKIFVLDDPDVQYVFVYGYDILPASFEPPNGTAFNITMPTITIAYQEQVQIISAIFGPLNITKQITSSGNEIFTYTLTTRLPSGTYTLSITVQDADNNSRTDTATYIINIVEEQPVREIPWLTVAAVGIVIALIAIIIFFRKKKIF